MSYYWRTNGATALGAAVAVAVLAGALLVGDSVRATLRGLVFERLGNAQQVVSGAGYFRERLAEELGAAVPMIAVEGIVTGADGGRLATRVHVWGVDDRFWRFHGRQASGPVGREAMSSPALASELGLDPGDAILLRLERPSAVPLESLHGSMTTPHAPSACVSPARWPPNNWASFLCVPSRLPCARSLSRLHSFNGT